MSVSSRNRAVGICSARCRRRRGLVGAVANGTRPGRVRRTAAGEIRALTWGDVDFEAGTLAVERSMLPDGTSKAPKTEAGIRTAPTVPALRRLLVAWRLRSPHTRPGNFVIVTADGRAVQERNIRRALDDAKESAGLDETEGRLSMHSLRHSHGPRRSRPEGSLQRRWPASRGTPIQGSPIASMRATGATKRRSWPTSWRRRKARAWCLVRFLVRLARRLVTCGVTAAKRKARSDAGLAVAGTS